MVKLLEENTRKKLADIDLDNDFLDMTPKAQATKAKSSKWNFKRGSSAYKRSNMKGNPQNGGRDLQTIHLRRINIQTCKKLIQLKKKSN